MEAEIQSLDNREKLTQEKLLDSLVSSGANELPDEDLKTLTTNIITRKIGVTRLRQNDVQTTNDVVVNDVHLPQPFK